MASELAALDKSASVLVVGAGSADLPGDRHYEHLPAEAGVACLEGAGLYDLVLVLNVSGAAEALLGRLRDLHARRVLVIGDAAARFSPPEMLALGFEVYYGQAGEGPAYLHDRDTYNREREWNSPENWANPENFDKYRW
ncbi:MAG: DUF6231 family protein [Gammaproteobacteria bacterium]